MAFKLVELYAEITARDAKFRKQMRDIQGVCKWTQTSLDKLGHAGRRLFIGLTAGATLALREFAQDEAAVSALNATLSSTGQGVQRWSARLQEAADRIEALTVYSDEFVLGLMTQGMNLGITADKIEEVTREAIGLATALKIDLGSAMRYMVMAHHGQFLMLRRMIPELKTTKDAHAQLAIVVRKANQGFKQAEAETNTLRGALIQLKNAAGKALAALGAALVPTIMKWAAEIKRLVPGFIAWAKAHAQVIKSVVLLTAKIALLLMLAPKLFALIWGFSRIGGLLGAAAIGGTAGGPIGALIGLLIGAGGLIFAIRKAQLAWRDFRADIGTPFESSIGQEIKDIAAAKGIRAAQAAVGRLREPVRRQPWWATGQAYKEVPHPSGIGTQLRMAPSVSAAQMKAWQDERNAYTDGLRALKEVIQDLRIAKVQKGLGGLRGLAAFFTGGPGRAAPPKAATGLGQTMDPTAFAKRLQEAQFQKNPQLDEARKHTGILGVIRDSLNKFLTLYGKTFYQLPVVD